MFLSKDAREALAEYLETERPKDAGDAIESEALFLSAAGTPARRNDGRALRCERSTCRWSESGIGTTQRS